MNHSLVSSLTVTALYLAAALLAAACGTPVVTGSATCTSASQGSCSKSGYCIDFPSSATALAAQGNNCSAANSAPGSGSGNMTYSGSSCATVNAGQTLAFSCLANGSNVNDAMLIRYYTTYTAPSGTSGSAAQAAASICSAAGGTSCQ